MWGMGNKTDSTSRVLPRHQFVLVVHDSSEDVTPICTRLRKNLVVHATTNPFDAIEPITVRRRACILCCLGRRIHAEDFYQLVARNSEEQVSHIVFVAGRNASQADLAFLHKTRNRWLPLTATPEEIYDAVRADVA